jgi:hypothetical protein
MVGRNLTMLVSMVGGAGSSGALVDYTPFIERLQFSSISPGGFGALRARLRLPGARARLPRPELGVLNGHVTVMQGRDCVYCGEVTEAALALDPAGEALDLVAQGGANALNDDPLDSTYANQTAQAIIGAEFSRRSAYLAVDGDQVAVLPNAPTATFSPYFDGRTIEDILHELCDLLGDYTWGVWNHPTHRDALGLPTWQVQVHQRDTATVAYRALLADVIGWSIAPAANRAFNGVTLHYLDPTAGPGSVTVTDARLNGDLSQGNAPFRFRRFRRDMGQRSLSSSQATALANQYLAAFENVSNVIEVRLAAVRDANGVPLPLPRVRADGNIAIPELLTRASAFPASPALAAGTNLFYIRQATYTEMRDQVPTLTLLLDSVADFAAADLTRLRYEEQLRQRSRRANRPVQPAGLTTKGAWSVLFTGAGQWGNGITFPAVLASAPTSLTFAAQTTQNISSGPNAGNFSVWGCDVYVTATATGNGWWIGLYTTNGNCLREVDPLARTARHHCDACDHLSDALPLAVLIERGALAGQPTYAVTCQACGARECFNPALTAADESDPDPRRAANARAIRAALALLG